MAAFFKVFLYRVPLNRQGYDSTGKYWGVGTPLYYWEVDWTTVPEVTGYTFSVTSGHLRASSRELARRALRKIHPAVGFYR